MYWVHRKKINFQKNSKTKTKITPKTIIFLTIFLLIFMYNFSLKTVFYYLKNTTLNVTL